jgi:hypothetical protein
MRDARRASPVRTCAFAFLVCLSLCGYGCASGSETEKPADAAATAPPKAAAPPAPFVPLDACTLLTKAEVEALAGKPVMDGRKEEAGPLVACIFGDPTAPKVGGRPVSQVLTLSVMTGQEGAYYAGATAQVKDAHEMARKNAAAAETVAGFGDAAYWDKILRKLSFVKGKYLVDVNVQSGDDRLALAKAVATKALEKLPQ